MSWLKFINPGHHLLLTIGYLCQDAVGVKEELELIVRQENGWLLALLLISGMLFIPTILHIGALYSYPAHHVTSHGIPREKYGSLLQQ
jgi:hypothetical protein